jgi:hypothetical protein
MDKVMGYMFQNGETGVSLFVDLQQVEWGFEKNNPRHIKGQAVHYPAYVTSLQERIEELEKAMREHKMVASHEDGGRTRDFVLWETLND